MKILNMIAISTVTTVISFSAFADQNHKSGAPCKSSDNTMQTMPMMGAGQNNMPMTKDNQAGMSMMGGNQSGMGMMGGNQGGMGMMQNMQQKQAMMQGHMVKVETHMANIEASLKELVELQKNE